VLFSLGGWRVYGENPKLSNVREHHVQPVVKASAGSLDTLDLCHQGSCQALRECLPVFLRRYVQGVEDMLSESDAPRSSLSRTLGIQQCILAQGSLFCHFQLKGLWLYWFKPAGNNRRACHPVLLSDEMSACSCMKRMYLMSTCHSQLLWTGSMFNLANACICPR